MDVANQRQQILFPLADNSFVPSLEEMAHFARAAVEVLRVGLLQPLHELGQRSGTGLNQQMHVLCEVAHYVK